MEVAPLMLPQAPEEVVRYATGWTDDMFMVSSLLSRIGSVGPRQPSGKLLTTSVPPTADVRDSVAFIHAIDGPHAWGRGNGFALLGVTEALTYLPAGWSARAPLHRHLSQARRGVGEAPIRRWQLASGR